MTTPLSPSLVELGNMLPGCAIDDVVDARSTYSEPRRHFFASNAVSDQPPYFKNVVVCNLGLTVARACRAVSFRLHVGHVLGLVAKPEVSRIHASGIVVSARAIVQHAHVIWDRAIGQLPGHSMRSGVSARPLMDSKQTIALAINGGSPQPATIWPALVNFFPEPIGQRAQFSSFAVMESDKSHRLALNDTPSAVGYFGDTSFPAASTMAVAVRNFIEGKLGLGELWGMLHASLVLQDYRPKAGTLTRRLPPFIGVLQEYFSTNRLAIQPCA